jgi:hypothetical protein
MLNPADPEFWRSPPLMELNSGAVTLNAGQTHRVWRGLVQTPGSVELCLPVVIKWLPSGPKLSIELACAIASAMLRLPVPPGMLVLADPEQLPGLPIAAQRAAATAGRVLCFGSRLQWPDDTLERLRSDDIAVQDHTWNSVCAGKVGTRGAAWDELVANPDRHTGNLIFDGTRHWLIDHDLALQPLAPLMRRFAQRMVRMKVTEHKSAVNQLASQMARRRPSDHGILAQPDKFLAQRRRLQALMNFARSWVTGDAQIDAILVDAEIVLRSIDARLPALALMLNERLGVPEERTLWKKQEDS